MPMSSNVSYSHANVQLHSRVEGAQWPAQIEVVKAGWQKAAPRKRIIPFPKKFSGSSVVQCAGIGRRSALFRASLGSGQGVGDICTRVRARGQSSPLPRRCASA